MSELPSGFLCGSIYCFAIGPVADANFRYLPGPPQIETVDGSAKASFFNSPAAPTLSLQLTWTADEADLSAAQAEIQRRWPELSAVDLRIAEVSSSTATLWLTGTDGKQRAVGPTETSGSGAYRVVFNETLQASEVPAAIAAIGGNRDVLRIDYDGTLVLTETANAKLSGDLAEQAKLLAPEPQSTGFFGKKKPVEPPPPPDLAACVAGVERALANGKLAISRNDTPNVSDASRHATEQLLRQKAAKQLFDTLNRMGPDAAYLSSLAVKFEVSEPSQVVYRIQRSSDLGAWFASHSGQQWIDVPPASRLT